MQASILMKTSDRGMEKIYLHWYRPHTEEQDVIKCPSLSIEYILIYI